MLAAQLLLVGAELWWPAVAIVLAGQGVRLWAVGHIGPASRTRDDGTPRVVDTGPYGRVRNPLYVGNWLMWVGVGALSGWGWALAWGAWMAVQVHLIVLWEEGNLERGLGQRYTDYLARVPRWLPVGPGGGGGWSAAVALKSERSTLLAVLVVLAAFGARSGMS